MRIKVGDKIYAPVARDEVSLRDLMLFNSQAQEFGITWSDVIKLLEKFDGLTEEQAGAHPDVFVVLGVTLWMARRAAGEDVTFSEAVDVNLGEVDFIKDPEDRQPGKPKGAKKKAPKASAPVAVPDPSDDETSAPPESESQSIPA